MRVVQVRPLKKNVVLKFRPLANATAMCGRGVLLALLTALGNLPASGAPSVAHETVWWRTSGAEVLETAAAKDQPGTCSLILYTPKEAAVFHFRKDPPVAIAFNDARWSFGRDGQNIFVAVEIGGGWLGHSEPDERGAQVVRALGLDSFVNVEASQPMEPLLRDAARIRVILPESNGNDMTLDLATQKMPALLAALDKCRTVLRREG